jgi:Phytanoyl-CoA dioxygenase (PhyH)
MELRRLSPDASTDDVVSELDERGYALVEQFLPPEDVAAKRAALDDVLARTPTGRNDFEGFETQRVYALFGKTRAFDDVALHPLLLGVLDRVLVNYQFSAPVAIHIGPGETAQVLHRDEDV